MSLLPANVGTGHVVGVFVNSDGQPETGKVNLRPRFTAAKITSAEPPTTVLPTPRSVPIGEDGRMAETEIVATNDPDLGLEDPWTYEVTFKFDSGVTYGPFDINVPEGETVDLTLVAPVAAANGVQTIRGFGVPDPSEAEDGDVVSYDATAGVTTWWSRSQAIGQAVTEEYEDPDSPLRASIDAAASRVADEALESRLSRTDRTRHAPSLGLFFPEAEGAIGNGEVDDTDAITAALTAATPGSIVQLAPRTYAISSLTLTKNVTLRGENSTLTKTGASIGTMISSNDADNARLENVTVDANQLVTGSVLRISAPGIHVQGCTVQNAAATATGITVGIGATANITIDNNTVTNCDTGIHVYESAVDHIRIRNNHVSGWVARGIRFLDTTGAGASNIWVQNNLITDLISTSESDSRVPMVFNSTGGGYFRNVHVTDNTIIGRDTSHEDPEAPGTSDQYTFHRLRDFTIANNISIDGGEAGMSVTLDTQRGTVTGNQIHRADGTGLHIWGSDMTVTGNTVTDPALDRSNKKGSGSYNGIMFNGAQDITCVGNLVHATPDGGSKILRAFHTGSTNGTPARIKIGTNQYDAGLTITNVFRAIEEFPPLPRVRKGNTTTRRNTDSVTPDPHLIGTVDGDAVYDVTAFIPYRSTANADMRLGFALPAGASLIWHPNGQTSGGTAQASFIAGASSNRYGGIDNTDLIARPIGTLTTTDPGDVTVQWAQGTAEDTDTTVYAGAWIDFDRVG